MVPKETTASMASNSVMIKKLQTAINQQGYKLLYSTSQFYSEQQNRPVTIYSIKQAYYDDETGKTKSVELYKSTSQIQIVFFLRDFWYEINGMEIPKDNAQWNAIKEKAVRDKMNLKESLDELHS